MTVQKLAHLFVGHLAGLDQGEGFPLNLVVIDVGADLLLMEGVQFVHILLQRGIVIEVPDGGDAVGIQLLDGLQCGVFGIT